MTKRNVATMRRAGMLAAACVVCLATACGLEERIRACQSQVSRLEAEHVTLVQEKAALVARVDELAQTADGLWAAAVRPTDEGGGTTLDEALLRRFLIQFPHDPRVAACKAHLATAEKRARERAAVERVASVTVEEIVADPGAYRRATFSRELCCRAVRLSEYVAATDIAELNVRVEKQYNTSCAWRWSTMRGGMLIPDSDSEVEVRMAQSLAKEFASHAEDAEEHSMCKYHVRGTLQFRGQVSYGTPVMFLTEVAFD